ncbi:MAG: RidA family protein [Terriglobales bacterium]
MPIRFPLALAHSVAVIALAATLAAAQTAPQAPERRHIKLPGAGADLPFSDAVLLGDTLYLGGHLGLDPKTGQAPEDTGREARLLLDSMQATLAAAGMTMDDLVWVQVSCSDLSLYSKFNAIYRTYFKKEFPARAFLGSATLLRGAHFEVVGIAVKR